MKNGIAFLVCMAVLFAAGAAGYVRSGDAPQAAGDEIMLMIRLDLKEDIGLLIIDHDVDGIKGSGGVSNADRSMIRRDDVLCWTFDRQLYDHPADTVELTVRFTVVTEYFDPDYDNLYPEEYSIPMEAVSFRAEFGETCFITITGDRVNGYEAVLSEQKTEIRP